MKKFLLFLFICMFCPVTAFAQGSTDDDEFGDPFGDPFASEDVSATLSYQIADPFEPVNRAIFYFNDKFYVYVFIPISDGFKKVVPECIRTGVRNVFDNFKLSLTFVSACLQGEFPKAWHTVKRFAINTTLGIGGFFDPADYIWGIGEPKLEDLGLTFGNYGIGHGFYIVLPFIGPSSLRDGIGFYLDGYFHPYSHFVDELKDTVALRSMEMINKESFTPDRYLKLKRAALDPYVSFRDIYAKVRAKRLEQ